MYDNTLEENSQQYFERLIEKYWSEVYRYAFKLTQGIEDNAYEVAQEVFAGVGVYLRDPSHTTIRNPHNYLMRSTKNCFFDLGRGKLNQSTVSLEQLLQEAASQREKASPTQFFACRCDEPEIALEMNEEESEAERSIQMHIEALPLDEESKECLMLHIFGGYQYKQIADIQNLPPGNVKSRISRGMRLLRTSIKPGEHDGDNNESVIR